MYQDVRDWVKQVQICIAKRKKLQYKIVKDSQKEKESQNQKKNSRGVG